MPRRIVRTYGPFSKLLFGAAGVFIGAITGALFADYFCYSVLAFFAFGSVVKALEPIARKRGWGAEGRLTRYLARPRFVDGSKQFVVPMRDGR